MKSFGLWYVPNTDCIPEVDLHINVWDIKTECIKYKQPFIEFGLKIKKFRELKSIMLFLPFKVNMEDIEELTNSNLKVRTASLIFNENCGVATSDVKGKIFANLTLKDQQGNVSDKYLLIGKEYLSINKNKENEPHNEDSDDYSILTIDIKGVSDDMDTMPEFKDAYIRFRIFSKGFRENLFSVLALKNLFLESAFSCTQIMDIKVNKIRNISEKVLKQADRNNWKLLQFNKIHFLVMESANSDVTINDKEFDGCRNLESEWEDYFKINGVEAPTAEDLKNVLAYHWKVKSKTVNSESALNSKNYLVDFSKLVKVTYGKTNVIIILVYVIVTVVLGALGSALFELIKNLF